MRTLTRQHDKVGIAQRLRSLRPDSRRRWGRMSVHQMVCHLADSLRMIQGDILADPNTDLFKATVLKWVVLYAPVRWPPGIRTCPELDQEAGGTRPVDFTKDVTELERLLQEVSPGMTGLGRHPHPLFGRMSGDAWLRWGYLHLDHHLRQFGA